MAALVGAHIAVTWKRLYFSPASATRSMMGVFTGPPNVPGLPKPESSMRTRSTFGAPSGGAGSMLIVQSPTDWSSVRPTVPPKFGAAMGSLLRSGLNLPIAVASSSFSARTPFLSVWATDFAGEPGKARSIASR